MANSTFDLNSLCPCRSGESDGISFKNCCGPYLSGAADPPTAEKLMRSRYSAYALGDLDHIKRTWHPETLPADLRLVPGQVWLGLKIKHSAHGTENDKHGIVEFVAKSKRNGRARRMHEISEFEKIAGRWVYVRGDYSAR